MKALERLLKQQDITVKVGILGDAGARDGEGEATLDKGNDAIDNAGVGLIHEFGTENTPERSWLRMPLTERFNSNLETAGAFDKKTMDKIIREKSFLSMAKKMGLVAVETIQEAFDTGGFGKWKPSDMSTKKNEQTLVETQQLRDSMTQFLLSTFIFRE